MSALGSFECESPKMNETNSNNNAARKAGHFSTHLGFAEYNGNQHFYDGNFEEAFRGTREEVIEYLRSLLTMIHPEEESLRWEGGNGWWMTGDEARAAIKAEILAPIADDNDEAE